MIRIYFLVYYSSKTVHGIFKSYGSGSLLKYFLNPTHFFSLKSKKIFQYFTTSSSGSLLFFSWLFIIAHETYWTSFWFSILLSLNKKFFNVINLKSLSLNCFQIGCIGLIFRFSIYFGELLNKVLIAHTEQIIILLFLMFFHNFLELSWFFQCLKPVKKAKKIYAFSLQVFMNLSHEAWLLWIGFS